MSDDFIEIHKDSKKQTDSSQEYFVYSNIFESLKYLPTKDKSSPSPEETSGLKDLENALKNYNRT